MGSGTAPSHTPHVLTVAPTRLGDTLFCTPAYRHLKTILPRARLTVVAPTPVAAAVLRGNPNVDHLLVQPEPGQVAAARPDRVVHLHRLAAAEPYLAAAGVAAERIGPQNDQLHCAEQTAQFVAERFGGVVDAAGYDLYPSAADRRCAAELIGPATAPKFGLHLGCHGIRKSTTRFWRAGRNTKAWPLSHFVDFAGLIRTRWPQATFFVTGSGAEMRLARQFARRVPNTVNLVDRTNVTELAALMAHLDLFVCNDTGPIHVACATPVPLIGLYGPTEFQRTGPYPAAPQRRSVRVESLAQLDAGRVFDVACAALADH